MKFRKLRRQLLWPFSFVTVWIATRILQALPYSALPPMARFIGSIVFVIPVYRRMITQNLRVPFPDWTDEKRNTVGKQSIQSIVRTFLEFLWMRRRPERINEFVSIDPETEEMFKRYEAMDNGIIAISPHIGNWELGNVCMNANDHQTWAVARKVPNPFMEALVAGGRKMSGAKIIHEKGAAREMLRVLKKSETVMMLIDQNTTPHRGGVFADFFGLPVPVSRAPASFARKTKSNVLVGRCVREEKGLVVKFRELSKPAYEFADDAALSREILRLHEEDISAFPAQYLWMYERFRYIPEDWDGDRSRYPDYCKVYKER